MKQHTEKMDFQLLEEKKRSITKIVTKSTRKDNRTNARSTKRKETQATAFDEEEPLNEYMAGVSKKRKDNRAK